MKTNAPRSRAGQAGFSLVELTIVVVILGVLAMMAVPRYATLVERAKSTEAYTYLAHVEKAQEIYRARHGVYADSLAKLSIQIPDPQHFAVGSLSSYDWQTRWNMRLTRDGASSGFGAYSVAWSAGGFDPVRSSIPTELSPTGEGGSQSADRSSNSGGSNGASGNSGQGPQGNNGVGNGNGGGREGNRGNGSNRNGGNNGRGPQGNNGVGNGNGGGREGNRGNGRGN